MLTTNKTTHIDTHARTHTDTLLGNGTEEKVAEKRNILKEDPKELTEAACWTETGSWPQAAGAQQEKERNCVLMCFACARL